MRMSTGLMAGVVFAGLVTGQAVAEPGVTDTEVVFGNILPLGNPTGALPGYGNHYGVKVAADEWNAKGGINGRKIVIKTEDDGYVPANAVQALRKLIDEGVFAMLATGAGGSTAAALPVVEENAIPTMVHFSPLNVAVEPTKPTIFMLGARYDHMLYAELKYILDNKKIENPVIGLIRQDDDFGAEVEAGFDRIVKETGLPSVPAIRFKRGQKDFGGEMLKMKAGNVNVLVAGAVSSEVVSMAKEGRKFGMQLEIASVPTAALPPVVKLMEPLGYVYYTGDYVAPFGSAGSKHFDEQAAKYVDEQARPALNRYSSASYAAAVVMFQAAERCGKELTRACLVEKLESGDKFSTNGVTSDISFTKDNHRSATAVQVIEVDPAKGTLTPVTEMTEY